MHAHCKTLLQLIQKQNFLSKAKVNKLCNMEMEQTEGAKISNEEGDDLC